MGQRTNIILVSESVKGRRNVKVYHDQWGIGRKSFLDLMTVGTALYNKNWDEDICDATRIPKGMSNAFQTYELEYDADGACYEFKDTEGEGRVLDRNDAPAWEDWFKPEKIGEFIKYNCDNNNGGMVVFVKETKMENSYLTEWSVEAKWLLGYEDEFGEYEYNGKKEVCNPENIKLGAAYSRWLTADLYAGLLINCKYADKPFMDAVKKFCNYFEIEIG